MSILQRNKKVAIGVGVTAAAAAAIALGTGTYAAFSATAAGPSGTLAAGTMALEVNGGAGTATLFDASDLYPTKTFTSAPITFKNVSPVDATLSGTDTLTDIADGFNDGNYLRYQMTQSSSCVSGGTTVTSGPTTLNDVGSTVVGAVSIPASGTATCTFMFNLPDLPNNNLVQGDKIKVDSTFTLTQKI